MATKWQVKNNPRIPKKRKVSSPALKKNPQQRGICIKVYITNPRKPNSAKRKVARIVLTNKKKIGVYIPGPKNISDIQKFSKLLIRGGNVRDLPSIRYRAINGKLDLPV